MNKVVEIVKSDIFLKYGLGIFLLLFIFFNLYLLVRFLFKKFAPTKWWLSKYWSLLGLNKEINKWIFVAVEAVVSVGLVVFVLAVILPNPKVSYPNSPSLEAVEITPDKPFKITFDRPINTQKLEKSISPEIEGEWQYRSANYLFLSDTLVFVPKVSAAAESRYTISLKNIRNMVSVGGSEYLLSFMAPPLPTVKSITPANGTEGFLPGQEITVETDFAHADLARLDFRFTPEVEIETTKVGDTKYTIKAKNGFKKSTTYNLEIMRTPIVKNYAEGTTKDVGEPVLISQNTFRTLEAPGVADYGPKGSGIMTDSAIWIEFKQDMDHGSAEGAINISPNVTATKTWETNRKVVIRPTSAMAKNTTYTVSVSKDAKAVDGSPFEDNFSYTYTTIGYVAVSSFYPGNNAGGVSTGTKISVSFNQAVDHASAESKFAFSPNVGGGFSWSGNTMTYSQSGLAYGTKYTVSIATGVKSVYGLDSAQGYSAAFTTQLQSVMLNVPSYHQSHMYSCMASAARSALAFKGSYVSEDYLLSLIGYDSTPFSGTWGDPNAVWGNPYSGIVGNVDGKSGGVNWGYGAYWGPTAKAINNYRASEVKTGWNVSGIAQEIANGNPVIVWWVNGVWPAYEVFWKTTGGDSVRGVNSMHVQVVKGFTGTVDNPTSFTVTDSGYGYPARTYDVGTFKAKWGWFGNSAVVVR